MSSAYNKDGDYIGEPGLAKLLNKKYGIEQFEKRTNESNVCSIGYSPRMEEWFGWSHRAISGFKSKQEAKDFAKSVA